MARRARKTAPALPEKGTDAFWYATLPKPPRGDADADTAEIWMRHVVEAGGMPALMWVWKPDNWPLGTYLRARLFHIYHQLNEEADQRARAAAAAAVQDTQADRRRAAHEARVKAGWA